MSFRKPLLSGIFTSLLFAPLLFGSTPLSAARPSIEETINDQVANYLDKSLGDFLQAYPDASQSITVRPLKKIPGHCQQTLRVSRRSDHRPPVGQLRLNVECPGQWRHYVTADVDVQVPAVHVRKALSRGDIITEDALQLLSVSWEKLRGEFFQKPEQVSGRQLRRSLSIGSLVSGSALVPDYLVQKGQVVTILAGRDNLYVAMAGIALESGLMSETIRVRNRSSGKVVDARVIAENKVQTGL
ncbi:flagellar basal body P-ring formation chaperone FlgA [Endozoicomonas sp. SCSIO W0465]|uniref:flagellar basal body P-ring formation chaperone FlgA n=1 Tax=Endozoicomonas sp. SCSIO W0465 TaxID=2918516 RepID=UPI0020763734|nr:flagellar basal body P-ring formation chaperone FlgA [Endozoicomonas sp. SCSIO W0465]USE37637.1 flagellar basal body P-ring formation chaperone FlgA [Endozoicomonas sp. SCSIO W0465]